MELAASPPADLIAIADAAARGAAPLLRPPAADEGAPALESPFALSLLLFAAPVPGGELLPVNGKELPPVPAETGSAAESSADAAPAPFNAWAPLSLDAVLQARQRASTAAAILAPATAPTLPAVPLPIALPPNPNVELTSATVAAAPQALDHRLPLAALTPSEGPLSSAVGGQLDEHASVAAAPTWLDELAAAHAKQPRPSMTVTAELRAASQVNPAPPSPFAPAPLTAAAAPAPDMAAQPFRTIRRDDMRLLLPVTIAGADTLSGGPTEWLPSAAPSTASASTPPPVLLPNAPVDVRTPEWHEAFASRVQWLVDQQVGEARIKLNPPELGAVDVKISLVEDKTYVQLTTATNAARDELSQNLPRLRELFSASGLELGGASVQSGGDGRHDPRGHAAAATRSSELPLLVPLGEHDGAPRELSRATSRIDVFA